MNQEKNKKKDTGRKQPDDEILEHPPGGEDAVSEEAAEGESPGTEPDELSRLREEADNLNDKLLRVCAEFDNYKKRTAKEKDEISSFAKSLCLRGFLEVLDNFERALAAECSDDTFKKGVEMICVQLSDKIKELGVSEIEAEGKPFDPALHNAVSQVENAEFGENTVCQVLQKGYSLDGRVIRHAMVMVANP